MKMVLGWATVAVAALVLLPACGGGGGEEGPAPTPEPLTPEVVAELEEEEPPDRSDISFVDNLLAKEKAGEWTRGEGLVATLKLFAGELEAAQVLRHPDLLDREGTGILQMAYEYLADGPDARAKAEITRLLDLLVFSNEQLEAMAGLSPTTAALPGRLAPGAASGSEEDCKRFFSGYVLPPGVGQCLEVGFSQLLEEFYTEEYLVFFPAPSLPQAGWTERHIRLAESALEHTVEVFKRMGKLPAVSIVFSVVANPAAEAAATPRVVPGYGPTPLDRPCGVVLFTSMQGVPDGHFKQVIAHELAHCFNGDTFSKQYQVINEFKSWWDEGLADYLSNVAYPTNNIEWRWLDTLAEEELTTSVFDRSYENFLFFQYLYHVIGNDGIKAVIESLPSAGGRPEQEAALAAYPGMDEMYHDFARAMTDGQIEDTGGALIPYPIYGGNRPTFRIAAPRRLLDGFQPFGVLRLRVAVEKGKEACLRWSGEALVVDARPTSGGDWLDVPSTLPEESGDEGDIILVVTATTPNREFELEATHVANLSGGAGGASLTGEWIVVNDSLEPWLRRSFPETRLDSISGEIRVTFRDDGKVEVAYHNFSVKGHSEGDSRLARILGEPELYTETTITTDARGTTSYGVTSLPSGDLIQFGSLFEENYLEGTETVDYYQGPYEMAFGGDPDAIPVDELEKTSEKEPSGTDFFSAVRGYDFQCGGFILRLEPSDEDVILYRAD